MGIDRILGGGAPQTIIQSTPAEDEDRRGIDAEEEERRRRRAAFAGISTTPLGVATVNQATGRSRLLGA